MKRRRYLWPPAAATAVCAVLLPALSVWGPFFSDRAYHVFDKGMWAVTCLLGLAGLALAAHKGVRDVSWRYLERFDKEKAGVWAAVLYAALFCLFLFLKYCQYRGFQLPMDTAMTTNMAFNVLHGNGLESSLYGTDYFAVHFQPLIVLYAPFLLIYNDTLTLIVLQTLAVASMPVAVLCLTRHLTRSGAAAACALILALTSPFLYDTAGTTVQAPVLLGAFFLWALYFFETRRWFWSAGFAALALMCSEQAAFAFAGMGLYWGLRGAPKEAGGRKFGWMLLAVSAVFFLAEMTLIHSYPPEMRYKDWPDMYGHLGSTPGESVKYILTRPSEFAASMLWPLDRYKPLWRLIYTTGLFAVFVPWTVLPWLLNYAPNFLAATGSAYHSIGLHYASQLVGPLWWAMALGIAGVAERGRQKEKISFLLPWVLIVGAFNLAGATRVLLPTSSYSLFREAPDLLDSIPPDASVWANEWVTAQLAGRRYLKAIPDTRRKDFTSRLFLPDYIVLNKGWAARTEDEFGHSMGEVIAQGGYRLVRESRDLIVLERPGRRTGATPASLTLPKATDAGRTFRQKLLRKFAVNYLEAKIAKEGGTADDYVSLGRTLVMLGTPARAEGFYRKALVLDPSSVEAKNNLANVFLNSGRVSDAVALYLSALEDSPGDFKLRFNLGNAYLGAKEYEKAAASYDKSIELNPEFASAYSNLGAVYFQMGRREKAVKFFRKALEIDPGFQDARKNLDALTGTGR